MKKESEGELLEKFHILFFLFFFLLRCTVKVALIVSRLVKMTNTDGHEDFKNFTF